MAVFKTAIEKSPKKGIDIIIANAGIYGPDILAGTHPVDSHESEFNKICL